MRHFLVSSQEGGWNPNVGLTGPLSQCWWSCPPWKVGVEAVYPHLSQLLGEANISWVTHFVHLDPVPVRPLSIDTGCPCAEGPE